MRSASRRLRFLPTSQQLLDPSVAIAEALFVNTRFFQQRQVNIRQSHRLSVFDVSAAFVPTHHDARQVRMVVERWVAETAADHVRRMVEQSTITIRCGFELVEEVREEG